jgi:hypothetical protein
MSENSGNEENKVGHLFIQVKRMKPIDNWNVNSLVPESISNKIIAVSWQEIYFEVS